MRSLCIFHLLSAVLFVFCCGSANPVGESNTLDASNTAWYNIQATANTDLAATGSSSKVPKDVISGVSPVREEQTAAMKKICYDVQTNKYVEQETLRSILDIDFCPSFVDLGSISRRYHEGLPNDVEISISYHHTEPRTKDICMRYLLGELTDGCYQPDNNPANYKGGGTATTGEFTFTIVPQGTRQPASAGIQGGCSASYRALWDEFWIWGHGFESDNFGEALKNELKGCALLSDHWECSYGHGDDGREWTAHFRTGVFQKSCVTNAFHAAGGPGDVGCSGSGRR